MTHNIRTFTSYCNETETLRITFTGINTEREGELSSAYLRAMELGNALMNDNVLHFRNPIECEPSLPNIGGILCEAYIETKMDQLCLLGHCEHQPPPRLD